GALHKVAARHLGHEDALSRKRAREVVGNVSVVTAARAGRKALVVVDSDFGREIDEESVPLLGRPWWTCTTADAGGAAKQCPRGRLAGTAWPPFAPQTLACSRHRAA